MQNLTNKEKNDELKDFTLAFFNNLKCLLEPKGEELVIKNVPKDFEDFYGKKSPYTLVFTREKERDDTDLIAKGSFLLKTMADYLETRGQTTLLKMQFDIGDENELKKHIMVKNCEVSKITKKCDHEYIIRFSFATNFQYLNEKEQLINNIFVQNGKVIDFDISKYKLLDGKREEVSIKDAKVFYEPAKEKVKQLIQKRTAELKELLTTRLKKEIARISEHYDQQTKEIVEELDKASKHIEDLEFQLAEAKEKNKAKEVSSLELKIMKASETLEKLKANSKKDELEKEKQFFITDEMHKHGLNISNNLTNTSIIYYPIFKLNVLLKKNKAMKQLEIFYNPLTGDSNKFSCENCNKELKAIEMCSSGHLACSKCQLRCLSCGKDVCPKCRLEKCAICSSHSCHDCSSKCYKCRKTLCKRHVVKDKSGKEYCSNCIKTCSSCGSLTESSYFKKCPSCQREICPKCSFKEFLAGKKACKNCDKNAGK